MISRLLHQTKDEDVYEIDCAGWNVTCIVINHAPLDDRNWLWELLRGERSRWKSGSITAILKKIEQRLKNMETPDPEIEAFESEQIQLRIERKIFKALVDRGIAQGIKQSEQRIARKMIEAGMTNQEIAEMTELPRQKIAALRKKIK